LFGKPGAGDFPVPIASEGKSFPLQRAKQSEAKHDAASRAHLQIESRARAGRESARPMAAVI
jgi:hypothetical protein